MLCLVAQEKFRHNGKTRLGVIKPQKADVKLGLILLNRVAGENWEEMKTHASRNFWISLLSPLGFKKSDDICFCLHCPISSCTAFLKGKGKHSPLPQVASECKGAEGGLCSKQPCNQHCCSTEGDCISVMMSISSSQEKLCLILWSSEWMKWALEKQTKARNFLR